MAGWTIGRAATGREGGPGWGESDRGILRARVAGASVWGPGLEGWEASLPVLAGQRGPAMADVAPPAPALLSPTERRRSGMVVRLALAVAQEAAARSGLPPASLRAVFASSNGDGAVVGRILEVLSGPDRQVSPTQFHNSVHNAAAGYWSIGTGSPRPATCLGAHDFTLGAALLKALAEVAVERSPVLLVAYDAPLPPPLSERRPTELSFAVGLVLVPDAEDAEGGAAQLPLPRLEARFEPGEAPPGSWAPRAAGLRRLSEANPAAQSLRLLEALATGAADAFALPLLGGSLALRLRPFPDPCPGPARPDSTGPNSTGPNSTGPNSSRPASTRPNPA